jgi:phosphomannomutase/phosphoglucomutase
VATLGSEDIKELKAISDGDSLAAGKGTVRKVDVREAYIKDLSSRVKPKKKMKLVLDCGNGTAALFAVEAYERAGFEVMPLFCEPDPLFPNHFPNPSETKNRAEVRRKVVETKADLGLSFDGDGDRVLTASVSTEQLERARAENPSLRNRRF